MRIGLMTPAFPELTLHEIMDFAAENGFQTLEVACWPAGEEKDRKYGGVVHIDVESLISDKVAEINQLQADKGVEITALGYYVNPLHPDQKTREHDIDHTRKVILGAEKLGVGIIGVLVGRSSAPERYGRVWKDAIEYGFKEFRKVWPDLVKFAADHNVKIATEHCPMLWNDTWPEGDNLPYSPAIMHRMFEILPDENFGIMLDPSHFIWQQIDSVRFIKDFSDRIFHVHAKDMTIDREMFYQDGILGCGFNWQIPRLPGRGLVDWKNLIAALVDAGYDDTLNIEHEDAKYEGSVELVKRGLLLSKKYLVQFVA
jgi:sugar phosphate isomerase/epimerase